MMFAQQVVFGADVLVALDDMKAFFFCLCYSREQILPVDE